MGTFPLFAIGYAVSCLCAAMDSEAVCAHDSSAQCSDTPARDHLLLQSTNRLEKSGGLSMQGRESKDRCDEAAWPDRHHGLVCGECKVLVKHFKHRYGTCRKYCNNLGRRCVGAWEEIDDTCRERYAMSCDHHLSSYDAICECGDELPEDASASECYGEFAHLVVDEGKAVGYPIITRDAEECQRACSERDDCNSVSFCPQWHNCWMKDKVLKGDEPVRVHGRCKTLYKKQQGCTTHGVNSTISTNGADTTSSTTVVPTTTTTTTATATTTTATLATSPRPSHTCYESLSGVAVQEGKSVGSPITTASAELCERRCNENSECRSFTLCPGWHQCFLKDRVIDGAVEVTDQHAAGRCKTYYQAADCTTTTTTTTTCSGSSCRTISVMSYNTEYKHYHARMAGYAAKIKDIMPTLVGLQECQDRDGLARLSGYTANKETGHQNYMLFDPAGIEFISGGHMRIPSDRYAPRFITWGKFMLDETIIWFFNTHLPHNHGEAESPKTHAKIAQMFLHKRKELGAHHAPTIMVGDMNSHASHFNHVEGGGFESNLMAHGFTLAYTAHGFPGHPRIDHILYSSHHWSHSNCRDTGTGGSDHTSITCDLQLK